MENLIKTDIIENYIRENNLSVSKFCNNCKISSISLNKILKGNPCNFKIVFKIARFMGISIKELIYDNNKTC